MPEPADLHIDRPLSNLSIKYTNEELIWREVLPVVKVGKRSDKFYVRNKADAYETPDDTLGPKSLANEISWSTSTDNYSVTDHGLADYVTEEEKKEADSPLEPMIECNENLNEELDNNQEVRVATKIFTAANYPAGNKIQLSGTSQWGGSADDPIGNILDALEACFKRGNTLVFGVDAWLVFRKLPEILDAVKSSTRYQGSPGGLALRSEVAGLFEVEKVLVGRGRKVTSKKGQTATYGRIWGGHCAALYVPKAPGKKTMAFGYTFVETDRLTMTDFDVRRGVKGATYVKTAWNSDEKIIASDVGSFIEDAV
ncbi:MAG: hypothetical protein V3T30_01410 [Thermodesulfobacteriota bacterium]